LYVGEIKTFSPKENASILNGNIGLFIELIAQK
jgi:hypothetical protein